MPAALENCQEADQVAVDVGLGILERIADSGLGREVDHPVEPLRIEQRLDALPILHRDLPKLKPLPAFEPGESIPLQGRRVVGVEIVDSQHRMPGGQEPLGDERADESGRPGDEDPHR